MDGKKVSPQSILGQLGANLIERFVLQMKYVWRPLHIFDVGIDGEIEICDPSTGEATGFFIKVQAKATERAFQAETSNSFEFTCDQRDLDYWLRGNAPVILIVCRPNADEAYWVSIKDYFREPAMLKTRRVVFGKGKNRFDASSAAALNDLAVPKNSGVYFSPLQKTDILYSNLLQVKSFAPHIYIAESEFRHAGAVWEEFKRKKIRVGGEWFLKDERIFSFHDLENPPFNAICDIGTLERFDSNEWAESTDEDTKRDFVRLLNLALRERTRRQNLWYDKSQEYFYFGAPSNLRTLKITYQSLKLEVSREVFKKHGKKKDQKITAYCRHSAFWGDFLRLGDNWFLQITPTYHFTRDGKNPDGYREEHVAGIKRLERNPAVIGHLLMWADYLQRPTRDLFSQEEYAYLSFGELERVELDVNLPDDIWYAAEEGQEAETLKAEENQPALFGL